MNRPALSMLAAATALVAMAGLASLGASEAQEEATAASTRLPVQRSELTCPRPTAAQQATTVYGAFTPEEPGGDAEARDEQAGAAGLVPAPEFRPGAEDQDDQDGQDDAGGEDGGDEPVVPLEEPGVPVSFATEETGEPALTGVADGRLAPGWTVQQTTTVEVGGARGMLGTACQTPDTGFWFAGASTAESRADYVHIVNPDAEATVVDIALYGEEGEVETEASEGITVPGGSSVQVRLSTLTDEEAVDLAVRVSARTGRIGALIETADGNGGADWLAPSAASSGPLVLPGIPADATAVRLVAFAHGDEDVSLDVALAGAGGSITPAGNESLSIPSGTLVAVNLGALTQGEAGSLVLTPAAGSGDAAVAAAVQVVRGEGEEREMAFVPATPPVERRAVAAGNLPEGTLVALAAPAETAQVEVTYSAGADGGEAVTETFTVDAGTTLSFAPELPETTKGRYGITLAHAGGGPLYASRMLEQDGDDGAMFTIQPLPDDRSTVVVPETGADLSILTD